MSSNLQVALRFLEYYPQAKMFPSGWNASKEAHRPRVAWGQNSSGDPRVIKAWAEQWPECNFCINLRASGMSVIDTDNKKGKQGDGTLAYLEHVEYEPLPPTLLVSTPSGGHHRVFLGDSAFCTDGRLGSGLDVPVMVPVPGSLVEGKGEYKVVENRKIAKLPDWFVGLVGEKRAKVINHDDSAVELDLESNVKDAISYLVDRAPGAMEGDSGDTTAFKVVCRVRDLGISLELAADLVHEYYAPKCFPYDPDWLQKKVENAYRYAQEQIGTKAPPMHMVEEITEAQLAEVTIPPTPLEQMIDQVNETHALTSIKGKAVIVKEREDGDLDFMRKADFETFFANNKIPIADGDKIKMMPAAKLWLESPKRRNAAGVCFRPDGCRPGYINLWRGFAVEPNPEDAEARCAKYRWHVENIICGGDPKLIHYVWSWLADIIQRPGSKPGVALVLCGGRGTGKGFFTRPLEKILGQRHFIQINNKDQFIGRFNSQVADKLLVVADEAFWAGDKAAEGKLKGFITEPTLTIEPKGIDAFTVDSYHRVIMASNEQWVVPAGTDERRFLVLSVSREKQKNEEYFSALAKELNNGGTEALMSWLGRYQRNGTSLRHAPHTDALMEQKIDSLEPHLEWWFEKLQSGKLGDLSAIQPWPETVCINDQHKDFQYWCAGRNIKRPMKITSFRKLIFGADGVCPKGKDAVRKRDGEELKWVYTIPDLESCRRNFERALGGSLVWEDDSEEFGDL